MQDEKQQDPGGGWEDDAQDLAEGKPYPQEGGPPPIIAVGAPGGFKRVAVSFGPKDGPPTPDESLWREIQARTASISFGTYNQFIDSLLTDSPYSGSFAQFKGVDASGALVPSVRSDAGEKLQAGLRTHLHGPDAFLLLRVATECFLMHQACEHTDEFRRSDYIAQGRLPLPYLQLIRERLAGTPVGQEGTLGLGRAGHTIPHSRLFDPCFIELIWSYWHEQGMLVQTVNSIAVRYQNIRRGRGRDALAGLELDPLRPLNNLLWGYLQEEHRQLSVVRRAYEYDHHYGLRIYGRAVPPLRPADSRAKFLSSFHELLYQAHAFFRDDDIATVQADAFPVLNALRELHFVLAEGAHNQFGDLPSQARGEMLIQQWLLARPEMREFLRGRTMVPYPEPWMDCVDTMKTIQGWTDVPVLYFNELGVTGEQLLLSVRYADWATQTQTSIDSAANWARTFRGVIQRYLYAYRMVTGVDLAVDRVEIQAAQLRDAQPPIRRRPGALRPAARRAVSGRSDAHLLTPGKPQALPGSTGVPVPARATDRGRRR